MLKVLSEFCFMFLDAASDHGENAGEVFEEEKRKWINTLIFLRTKEKKVDILLFIENYQISS